MNQRNPPPHTVLLSGGHGGPQEKIRRVFKPQFILPEPPPTPVGVIYHLRVTGAQERESPSSVMKSLQVGAINNRRESAGLSLHRLQPSFKVEKSMAAHKSAREPPETPLRLRSAFPVRVPFRAQVCSPGSSNGPTAPEVCLVL